MLTLLDQHPKHPGFGPIDLSRAAVGDEFWSVIYKNTAGGDVAVLAVERYKVTRSLKLSVIAARVIQDGDDAPMRARVGGDMPRFDRSVPVPGCLSKSDVQWALDQRQKNYVAMEASEVLRRSTIYHPEMLDDELIVALLRWRTRRPGKSLSGASRDLLRRLQSNEAAAQTRDGT